MIGARTSITSVNPPDGSNEAAACATFYNPIVTMLLRSAHWGCARRQTSLAVLRQIYVNGVLNPPNMQPPTPWWYEYAAPSDSLKDRFILSLVNQTPISPPLTTGPGQYPVPQTLAGFARFTPAIDTDPANPTSGTLIKVILTNQPQAQLVYTADISQVPDLWDSQFHIAASSALASYLVNPLARNAELLKEMVASASAAIAAARATDGNESLPTQDHIPDFIRIRMGFSGGGFGAGYGGAGILTAGYDTMQFPGGLWF